MTSPHESAAQNTVWKMTEASAAILKAIIEKYSLPEDEVYQMASDIIHETLFPGSKKDV